MKQFLLAASLGLTLTGAAPALTINLDAESLKDALGQPMNVGGLVVLTAAPSGTFFGPTPTSFTGGDEMFLMKWDLSSFNIPGVFSDTVELVLSGNWNEGDPLRLYWYPELVLGSEAPGAGTAYGTYHDPVGLNGSSSWLTPSEAEVLPLKFFTSDAKVLLTTTPGANPPSAGFADQTVIPEPGSALMCILGGFVLGARRHRRSIV
jgi:hypothetical protein